MSKKVYLAGGMEFAADGKSWRDNAVETLAESDIDAWEPYEEEAKIFSDEEAPAKVLPLLDKVDDFERMHKIMRKIVCMDLTVVSTEVDAIMVKYDKSVLMGAGTHAEISIATLKGIPVHVWLEGLTLKDVPIWAIGCFDSVSYNFDDTINNVKRSLNETT